MSDRIAREVVVHGHVQGVFFRDSLRREAESAGVAGWVGNEADGSVRARLEGPRAGVERLVSWAHQGPPHASVERVDVHDVEPEGLDAFRVR
jgi:acylphosphatase